MFHCCHSAHGSTGTMTSRTEGALHAARLSYQDPARPAHVPGNDHRLPDAPIRCRYFRMLGRESARGSLAMHAELLAPPRYLVLLEFGNVMAYVIDQIH